MKSATGPLRSAGPLSEVQCQSGVQQFGFRSAALLLEALKPDSLNDTKLFQQSPLLMNATYLCRGQSQPRSTKGRLPDEKNTHRGQWSTSWPGVRGLCCCRAVAIPAQSLTSGCLFCEPCGLLGATSASSVPPPNRQQTLGENVLQRCVWCA